jgi:hypothetical protein
MKRMKCDSDKKVKAISKKKGRENEENTNVSREEAIK